MTVRRFGVSARHSESATAPPSTVILALPPVAARALADAAPVGERPVIGHGWACSTLWVVRPEVLSPSPNTNSCETVPPFDDVGVPPTVTATYSRPPFAKTVGPAAIGFPVLNDQSTLPVRRSKARSTPSPPPANPRPLSVVVTPPRSGSGVRSFHTRRPVETSIALIDPWSCQPANAAPKFPFSSPRYTSPSKSLRRFCVGDSFCWISTAAVSAAALNT